MVYYCFIILSERGTIHELKVKEAQFLLRTTDQPLSVIAEELGFSSQQYFQAILKNMRKPRPMIIALLPHPFTTNNLVLACFSRSSRRQAAAPDLQCFY